VRRVAARGRCRRRPGGAAPPPGRAAAPSRATRLGCGVAPATAAGGAARARCRRDRRPGPRGRVTLFLLRHAIAEDERPGGTDRDRRLPPRGRTRMRRAAPGLRRLTGELDAIYTSPYPRAAETAAIVAAG